VSFRRFFLVRLGWALIGVLLAVTIVFVTTRVLVSPAEACRWSADRGRCHRALVEELDLDDPVPERYLQFVWRLVAHGSPGGSSLITGADAGHVARQALPVTVALVSGALVLALALGAAAGIGWSRLAARWDRLIRLPIYLVVGLAPFFLGLLLSYAAFKWKVTPVTGYCDLFNPPADQGCGGARDWLSHLVLPVVTLSLFPAAIYTRIVHAGVADVRATQGKKERRELGRRFLLAMARVVGRDFGWVIGAAFLVESTFSIPGLGRTVGASNSYADPVVLEAALLYAAVLAIAVHFLVDVIVGALDSDLRAEWPVAGMPKPT
jgi:ABC-type dipeptide/oligopeptide/nickel transport system permease component